MSQISQPSPHRASSTKTRIKTLYRFPTPIESLVLLTEHLPLKQGLRLRVRAFWIFTSISHRASSTKTRIKTLNHSNPTGLNETAHRASSTKTRIKTKEL